MLYFTLGLYGLGAERVVNDLRLAWPGIGTCRRLPRLVWPGVVGLYGLGAERVVKYLGLYGLRPESVVNYPGL